MTTHTILAGIFSHDEWIEPEEIVFSSGATVSVAKCSLRFEKVGEDPSFGNKPLVEFEGEALYPELAILQLLQKHGFDGVWVDTYRSNLWGAMSAEQILPDHAREVYGRILQARDGRLGGFWDVFAWREGKFVFIESKQNTADCKDKINENQKRWLETALAAGFDLSCFAICEWKTEKD